MTSRSISEGAEGSESPPAAAIRVLMGPKKSKKNEPISRAYERAETVEFVGASCASSIRTHPVVQKEQGVSAYGQTWWVLSQRL